MKIIFDMTTYEVISLILTFLTAAGTIGACLIAVGLVNIKRLRIKTREYKFNFNEKPPKKNVILNNIDSLDVTIINDNYDLDLIIQNVFLTSKTQEMTQFCLRSDDKLERTIIMPGAYLKLNLRIYGDINCKSKKNGKPLRLLSVFNEWKRVRNEVNVPEVYFDTNLGRFTAKPSRQAKKLWKKGLKEAKQKA